MRKTNSRITGAFNEGIMGAKTTKTLVREEANMQEFGELTHEMRRSSVRAASLNALYLPIVISLGSLATAYALWRGGNLVLAGAMSLGVIQVFVNYTVQFFEPVRNIAGVFSEMQSAQAAAERVMTLLDTQPDIVDSPEVVAQFGDNFHPKRENWPELHGDIDFEHVDFKYQDGERVLTDFNLHVKAGETIALVGPTGAGKSTVPMLVMMLCWCIIRVIYVTVAVKFFPVLQTVSWAYPITWGLSTLVFTLYYFKADWMHAFERREKHA